ncbi:hypothetical protein GQF49_05695 [Microbacter sp. ANSKLAB05]|nr:hypothetical protein [Microbacter sp. ANSKLAB05]
MRHRLSSRIGVREEALRLKETAGRRVAGQPDTYRPKGNGPVRYRDRLAWRLALGRRPSSPVPDTGVCERQAVGGFFTDTDADVEKARRILDGWVALPPHGEWELPQRIRWTEDPFGEANWKFQFHTLRWVDPLRRVALKETSDSDRAAQRWLDITRSWMDACLHGANAVAWKDMAVGMRTIEFVLGYPLVPERDRVRYLLCVEMHAKHLANPRNHARGNHLLHQLQGLYVASRFLRASDMEHEALAQLNRLFRESYDEEGVNAEGALGYHDMNYQWWRSLEQRVAAENGEIPDLSAGLSLARKALIHGVRPDGMLETIGDTSTGKVPSKDGFEQTEFVRSKGAQGSAPEKTVAVFSSGYIFGRSGWGLGGRSFTDETFYSLRFGADKPMHGHRDSTSFTVFGRGVAWVVDPGMYGYGTTEMRKFMCGRAAHNVMIDLDCPEHSTQSTELLSWRTDEELDVAIVSASPSASFRVRRSFAYHRTGDFFVVMDHLPLAGAPKPSSLRQLWHLAPEVEVSFSGRSVRLDQEEATARITWLDCGKLEVASGAAEPLQGWVTSEYGKAVPAPVVSASYGSGRVSSLCAVMTFGDRIPDIKSTSDGVEMSIEVTFEGERFEVVVPNRFAVPC